MIHLEEMSNLNFGSFESLDSELLINNSAENIEISFENLSDLEEDYKSNSSPIMTKMLSKKVPKKKNRIQ